MSYIFRGRLCGYICDECQEPLARVKVRLYRTRKDQNVTALAVASPKDTFAILTADEVKKKESSLIAEFETNDAGEFVAELGDQHKYKGEAFEIDVYCENVPGHKQGAKAPQPVQFSLTVLQPLWREREGNLIYVWDYCLPARLWCFIRGRFGVWVICGRVTVCDNGQDTGVPVANVKVRAFDVDWIQDDEFGSDTTDSAGHFQIYYTPSDFRVTPFTPIINVEWVSGPDVYFRVETLLGTALLTEPRSQGRTPQRENRGPCTCVRLCIDKDQVPTTPTETLSVFNKIGAYNFLTQIDSGAAGDGLTLADDRAFFSTLRLNGILAKTKNGNPLEYMFEVAAYNPTTDVLGAYTQIPLTQVAPTNIGTWEHFTGDIFNPVETKDYILNGVAGPTTLVPVVSPDGWVRVPQESNVFAPQGNFVPSTGSYPGFINLISQTLRAFGVIDEALVQAGETAGPPNATLGRVFYFSLRMKVREAIGGVPVPGSEQIAGTCIRLAVMNTLYDNVAKNGSWVPHTVDGQLCVSSLDISELAGGGCTEITNSLTVVYTAAHPNLGSFAISMTGPGGPYTFTPGGGGTPVNRFGTATNDFNIADLPDCAYIVKLSVNLLLTTGDSSPDPVWDEVAFCKNSNP
jgi:hypothetical protein